MKTYELTYIITPEISSEEAEAKSGEIAALIQKNEGVVLKQTVPSAKALAYPVKKSASGFFGVLEFEIGPENLNKIKPVLTKDEKIVRQIITIKKTIKADKANRRKTKISGIFKTEKSPEETKTQETSKLKPEKEKVELEDIDKKLNELLA